MLSLVKRRIYLDLLTLRSQFRADAKKLITRPLWASIAWWLSENPPTTSYWKQIQTSNEFVTRTMVVNAPHSSTLFRSLHKFTQTYNPVKWFTCTDHVFLSISIILFILVEHGMSRVYVHACTHTHTHTSTILNNWYVHFQPIPHKSPGCEFKCYIV